jgi:hypothetical protein
MQRITQFFTALLGSLGNANRRSAPEVHISFRTQSTPDSAPRKANDLEIREPLCQDEFTMLRALLKDDSLFEGDTPSWRTNGRGRWDQHKSAAEAADVCVALIRRKLVECKPAHCCAEHAKTHRVFSLTPRGRSFIEHANTPLRAPH